MNRKNLAMTARLQEVLASDQYKDPKQFTTTIFNPDGKQRQDLEEERDRSKSYYEQFIPVDQARDLERKLRQAEALDKLDKLIQREDDVSTNPHSSYNKPHRQKVERSGSEHRDKYNWKTRIVKRKDREDG